MSSYSPATCFPATGPGGWDHLLGSRHLDRAGPLIFRASRPFPPPSPSRLNGRARHLTGSEPDDPGMGWPLDQRRARPCRRTCAALSVFPKQVGPHQPGGRGHGQIRNGFSRQERIARSPPWGQIPAAAGTLPHPRVARGTEVFPRPKGRSPLTSSSTDLPSRSRFCTRVGNSAA